MGEQKIVISRFEPGHRLFLELRPGVVIQLCVEIKLFFKLDLSFRQENGIVLILRPGVDNEKEQEGSRETVQQSIVSPEPPRLPL
jgi:hypothetical protein